VPFQFSRRPNRAAEIAWREWSEAVAQATADDRPLFLCLTTTWCQWCHALDEGAFSDDIVISTLNRSFTPARVDVDERPDIALRYSLGGWPTVACLTPEGETIAGGTFLTGAELVDMLDNVQGAWISQRDEFAAEVTELRMATAALLRSLREQPAVRALTPEFLAFVTETALSAFDAEYGGFGRAAKFPRADILETLLLMEDARARTVLERTLDALTAGEIHDRISGSFYRYAAERDWSAPHTERLLTDNAALAIVFAQASRRFARPDLAATAAGIVDFMNSALWIPTEGAFAHALAAGDGGDCGPTGGCPTYTDANATAIRALVWVETVFPGSGHGTRAEEVAGRLWSRRSARGLLARTPNGPDCYLNDQLAMLEAALQLNDTGLGEPGETHNDLWLNRAEELWGAIDSYFTVSGKSVLLADVAAPVNVPPDSEPVYEARVGRLARTETPLPENARAAACAALLARARRDEELAGRARLMLEQLAPSAANMGNYSIGLARAALIASGTANALP